MGNKILKYFSLFVLGSVILAAGLLIVTHFLVTPQRVRDAVLPVLEQQLQRKVHLSSVDVSLFSGVTLTQLEILDHDNRSMLIAADKVVLRYQFWPLFLQRVVIDEIRLEHPRLNVERFNDGHFNFSDLFNRHSRSTSHSSTVVSNDDNGIDLLISELYVNRGELVFKDHSFGGSPHRYKLTDFDLKIGQLSFEQQSTVALWGKLNGAPLDVEGTFALGQKHLDVDVIIDNLNLIPFQPYYRQQLDGRLDDLILGVDLNISGAIDSALKTKGTLRFKQLDLVLNRAPQYPIRSEQISVVVDSVFSAEESNLHLHKFDLNYDGILLQVLGSISSLDHRPHFQLAVEADSWSLREVVSRLPTSMSRTVIGFDPAGDVSVSCSLLGDERDVKELIHQARIILDGVQMTTGGVRPSLKGTINLNDADLASESLELVLGDTVVELNLASDNWRAVSPVAELTLSSDVVDLGRISSSSSRKLEETTIVTPATSRDIYREVGEPGPVSLPLTIAGSIEVGQFRHQQLQVEGLRANYELKNNVLNYQDLVGRVANGTFRMHGQVDLRQQGFLYKGSATAQDLQLEVLVPQVKPDYQGVMSGRAAIDGVFSGAGTQSSSVQQNLSGSAMFTIEDGQMTGTELLAGLSQFVQIPELQVFRFQHGSGDIQLATGGRLSFDGRFVGSRARIYPQGVWTFDGVLDSRLNLHLSPEVVAKLDPKSKLSSYLSDDDGWGAVPLRISGRHDKPRFAFDLAAIGRTATQQVTKKIQKKIQEKMGTDAGNVLSEPGSELINSTLEGLLGR